MLDTESGLLSDAHAPIGFVRRREPSPSVVFDTYWRFATERQNVYMKRVQGAREPWTSDPIIRQYKFTNAYRAADRVSQYLIRNVIYDKDRDVTDTVMRILLFKLFNKIDTWELLSDTLGEVNASTFSVARLDKVLSAAMNAGASIYSAAYIMPSGPAAVRKPRKHLMHLELIRNILKQRLPERLVGLNMKAAFDLLHALPGIGPFLAYQFIIDLNYSAHFQMSEMEFVVPGPGARDGLRKCFVNLGDYTEADVIRWVADRQDYEFSCRGLQFTSLWGRPLQLIDCQNLFCEVDKYARVKHPEIGGLSGRTRIKQKFVPSGRPTQPFFPPKWRINDRIVAACKARSVDQRH